MSEEEKVSGQESPGIRLDEERDENGPVKVRGLHSVVLEIFVIQVCLGLTLGLLVVIGYLNHMGSLFFGLIFGALGGSVALLRRVQSENAPGSRQLPGGIILTLMPMLYGSIMAGVAYLLFVSGILSGDGGGGHITSNLFPNFETSGGETPDAISQGGTPGMNLVKEFIRMQPKDIKEAAKLLVWCFIAGYSERFVFGVLSQLEQRGDGAKSA